MSRLVEGHVEPEAELGDGETDAEVLQAELEELALLVDVDGAEDGAEFAAGQLLPERVDGNADHLDLEVGLVPDRVVPLAAVPQGELQRSGSIRKRRFPHRRGSNPGAAGNIINLC